MTKDNIRLNIPIDMETNEKIEEHAKKIGVSKAGMVRVMIHDYFKQNEAMESLKQINTIEDLLKLQKISK